MASRRLFVGVSPSDEARAWLAEVSAALRRRFQAEGMRARWVAEENLHVTLKFVGDVPESEVPTIAQALSPIRATDRFEIGFSGLGAFPNEKKSRVIWVGFEGGRDRLKSLAEQVDRCLQGAGIAPESRPYTPHLTLARMKDRSENTARLMEFVSPREGVSSLVQEVVLFQSDLGPSGARYTPRARITLG